MTDQETSRASPVEVAGAWTCPFCPLLCDGFGVDATSAPMRLVGSDCPRAAAALARFDPTPAMPSSAEIDAAITAAARILGASRQPLFAGLGTDVGGARALYRLACDTGAICDASSGDALIQTLRVLQDRGGYTTTLAEVRGRADLIVCIGSVPSARLPEFFARCDVDASRAAVRVVAADDVDADAWQTLVRRIGPRAERLAIGADLFTAVAQLAAAVDGQRGAPVPSALAALAAALHAATYAVLVYEPTQLGKHGGLVIEAIDHIVATLNRKSRAATLPLGGGDGAATANQVFAWLSGLPLRSRAGPAGLEHEPLLFGADRLIAGNAVDALLWVSSFVGMPPMPTGLPRIVLGPPGSGAGDGAVFIPVSTPGIGSTGHLFRTDGTVLLPLQPIRADGLPTVAEVARRIGDAIRKLRGAAT